MTDTTTTAAPAAAATTPGASGALSGLRLPQLQALASELGVKGTSKMRKSDLLEAIRAHQNGGASAPRRAARPPREAAEPASAATEAAPQHVHPEAAQAATEAPARQPDTPPREAGPNAEREGRRRERQSSRDRQETPSRDDGNDPVAEAPARETPARETPPRDGQRDGQNRERGQNREGGQNQGGQNQGGQNQGGQNRNRQDRQNQNRDQGGGQNQGQRQQNRDNGPRDDEDDEGPGGRRRRNRYRDRKRRGGRGNDPMGGMGDEPELREDDVLIPVAGILDILDSYAFIRTSGYLPGPNDVYVSLAQVKKNGMRKGDAVIGAIRQPRDDAQGQRAKYNALVRLDSVNGQTPEQARGRVEFGKLTPLYPQERLRLETEPNIYTTRIIDLVAPIGKGQRGLIVSPPKAGKTLVLQAIANAITTNNPEAHLMVVLVDERPEEVTDMQRTIKGEVIASTFDRPADDHTTVAELAIERAKRLVEMGHDVVVLLDSITRLGRAYNIAAPASGRILSGGVDSSALYPPKRFFGAARNVENGGSLTILATALVETGSKADEVIFEEFKGTGNMELRLSRSLADKRVFPAVDVNPSGTRREEILLGREELSVMWKLRRVLTALDSQQSLELLLNKLKDTKSNGEFLMQVQKTSSAPGSDD